MISLVRGANNASKKSPEHCCPKCGLPVVNHSGHWLCYTCGEWVEGPFNYRLMMELIQKAIVEQDKKGWEGRLGPNGEISCVRLSSIEAIHTAKTLRAVALAISGDFDQLKSLAEEE